MKSQTFTGPAVQTEELNNTPCYGVHDMNVYECIGSNLYHKYKLTISAPAGWHFGGSPRVNCVQDNQGSFAWNMTATHFKMIIIQNNSNYIEAQVSVSSRSIMINLACDAIED